MNPASSSAGRRRAALWLSCAMLGSVGCAGRRPVASSPPPSISPPPAAGDRPVRSGGAARGGADQPIGAYAEQGNASWYGAPFHGRRASNGEIYDMNQLTAAHRTMAFNTMVRVTNLTNGKSVVVRITDRGPFIDNRIIDLSMAAAKAIDSIGPGVVPVRLEVVSGHDPFGGYFTVQVGAFKERGNAERLRERMDALYPPSAIQQVALEEGTFYRVRVGRIFGERQAQKFADDLKAKEGFHSMVVRIDDEVPGGSQ